MRLDNLVTPKQQTSKLDEGLRPGDLEHLILPTVSVDEFEPKMLLIKWIYKKNFQNFGKN